jgi:hypothetical protein
MRTLGSFNHPGPDEVPIAILLQNSALKGCGGHRSDRSATRPGWPPRPGHSSRNEPILMIRANTRVVMALPDDMPQIQILLAEYNTLRAEVIGRTTSGFQLIGIGFAIVALLLSQAVLQPGSLATSQAAGWRFWCVLVLGIVLLGSATWFNLREIGRAANRVLLLEKEINERAGERLLQWESRFSPGATGWFGLPTPLAPKE